MERIVVTGASGQIGSELVPELRRIYGDENVVAVGHKTPIPGDIREAGPYTYFDVSDYGQVEELLRRHEADTVFHLSSIRWGSKRWGPRAPPPVRRHPGRPLVRGRGKGGASRPTAPCTPPLTPLSAGRSSQRTGAW